MTRPPKRPPRGASTLLWDAHEAGTRILDDIGGRSLDDYLADRLLRDAVERRFITVGEALGALRRTAPEVAARVPELVRIVGFRNLLVHGYADVDDALVWRIARTDLPLLIASVAGVLRQLDDGADPTPR